MKLFVWRHNRRFHSWSMMDEPCVHEDMYTEAVAAAAAETEEQALELLAGRGGWRTEDLRRLRPAVFELADPTVVFELVR